MNIDFSQDATFSAYVIALLVSGLALIVVSAGARGRTRALDLLFGLGFLGYGIYLGFIFNGGTYQMFFYAFIAPVLMIVRTFKERAARTQPASPAAVEAAPVEQNPA